MILTTWLKKGLKTLNILSNKYRQQISIWKDTHYTSWGKYKLKCNTNTYLLEKPKKRKKEKPKPRILRTPNVGEDME